MVLEDWTTGGKATLVLDEGCRCAGSVGTVRSYVVEEITSVKEGVLMEPVSAAMVLVAAALGDDLHLRAGVAAEFSVKVVADQLEFLHAVIAEGSGSSFTSRRKIAADDAVNRDVVCASA